MKEKAEKCALCFLAIVMIPLIIALGLFWMCSFPFVEYFEKRRRREEKIKWLVKFRQLKNEYNFWVKNKKEYTQYAAVLKKRIEDLKA